MPNKRLVKLILTFFVLLFSIVGTVISNNPPKISSPFYSITPTNTKEQIWGKVKADSVYEVENRTQEDPDKNNQTEARETLSDSGKDNAGYRVLKVVDGDTFDVEINGKTERLRMIGIDTPETVDPRKSVQCFGKEASNKAKELLGGQFVTLESDPTQGDRDKYGRLLRYAFLSDGTNYGLLMISQGYAHEYTYSLPYKYQKEFKQAEVEARENNKGLWSSDTCSGKP